MIRKMRARLNEKKGFTLAELLIVVAIIAVLVAIAIPIFNTQLEKAREATDAANIRAAYAEVMAEGLTTSGTSAITRTVTLTQKQSGWLTSPAPNLAGSGLISGGSSQVAVQGTPAGGGSCTVTYNPATDSADATAEISFSGSGGGTP